MALFKFPSEAEDRKRGRAPARHLSCEQVARNALQTEAPVAWIQKQRTEGTECSV